MAQVWLVTGSSRGLGRAIVEAGLAAGNKVLATARDTESLRDLTERYGDRVKLFALDVTDESAAAGAVEAAIDAFGSLDVVINNAGYGNLSSVEDTPMSDFRAQIETNLFGTIIVTKAALPVLSPKEGGPFSPVFSRWEEGSGPQRTRALFGSEMGCPGFLRSVVARSRTARHQSHYCRRQWVPHGLRWQFHEAERRADRIRPNCGSNRRGFQRDYNGKQPGDPKKAAEAIVQLTRAEKPPLRLLLGSDAYQGAEKNDLARLEEARAWKDLSLSTDFQTKT